jgi:predicted CoA-binding protein
MVQLVGAISPPHHVFLHPEDLISEEALAQFPGDQVVLKIVSPDIVHKTEANGIVFVRKDYETVRTEIDRLIARHRDAADVHGVLVVEFVERVRPGFGNELFVGIRATREFGPVVAAGLGGIDTEFLSDKMRPGIAVAKASAVHTSAEEFLELFKATAAYDILSGRARGHRRIVSDGELLRCFRSFILLAQRFCVDRGDVGPDVAELEVNPFAFRQQRLIPLDGRGRLGPSASALPARPLKKIERLLEPRSIAVLGASSSSMNVGRIILNNIIQCDFPADHLYVIKENETTIDGVKCVPTLAELPETVDLLVIAAKQHAASSKWFPSVAELRGVALEIQARARGIPTAAEAWVEVMGQVRAHGYYGEPVFSYPLIQQAIDGLGGWRNLCAGTNQVADRAHFLRIYESLSSRDHDTAAMLPVVYAAVQAIAESRQRPALEGGEA